MVTPRTWREDSTQEDRVQSPERRGERARATGRDRSFASDDRGQAYTLEGFVGAIVVLMALLFALQSVVLTPTTAGTVDQDVKSQLRTQANDVLRTSANDGSLDALARYWNTTGTFAHANGTRLGYGSQPPCAPDRSPENVCDSFGRTLHDALTRKGFVYNLYLDYRRPNDPTEVATEHVVYRGAPSSNAVTATYTVVLYDDQTLTSPENASNWTLAELGPDEFYARDVDVGDADDGPIYNVVEVRLVVW